VSSRRCKGGGIVTVTATETETRGSVCLSSSAHFDGQLKLSIESNFYCEIKKPDMSFKLKCILSFTYGKRM
jgi:hypothetical protein